MKKILMLVAAVVAMMLAAAAPASAAQKCHDTTINVIVHHPAVTQTIEHPEVTHEVDHPAVEATPDLWWNWSPNNTQGPQDYTPEFPVDERGTWQGPHENGGPDQDTYGTFNSSNGNSGNSSWFHREHGTPAQDAWTETVVDQEAWTETVTIPAYNTTQVKHVKVCSPTDKPKHHVTVTSTQKHAQTPAEVPTVIESGLAGTQTVSADENNADGWILAGVLLLAGALLAGIGLNKRRN